MMVVPPPEVSVPLPLETAVSKALEVSGNPGLAQDNPLERHYRDALCARVHSPQGDTVWIAGGREALAGAI